MGVTCSSEGAAQYSLIRKLNSKAKRVFACKCAGETKVTAFKTEKYMICRIHFWQCPMRSNI